MSLLLKGQYRRQRKAHSSLQAQPRTHTAERKWQLRVTVDMKTPSSPVTRGYREVERAQSLEEAAGKGRKPEQDEEHLFPKEIIKGRGR